MKEKQELVNIILDRFLPRKDEYPKDLHKAMRYSVFAGGKRLRPYLTMTTFEMFHPDIEIITPVAAGIEMIHTYSLVHDDLPDIDDADMRRGKKSCHSVFGEGVALLAGDALLLSAFELITLAELEAKLKVQFVYELAKEVGIKGLIAGQMVDIESEGKKVDKKTLNYIHENKTARLINLSIRFGALAGKAEEGDLKILDEYGKLIGLVFQIVDDLLDIEGTQEETGKTPGRDAENAKATFPAVYGIAESHKKAEELTEKAREIIVPLGEKALKLDILAEYLLGRKE
ncbi:MAG TPA: polyprenyl synthetase family protein [Candidatus Cloacimonas sp.]|nr:polyprenyl synthetase family protein [Candidatus Cloacimonas sp.]